MLKIRFCTTHDLMYSDCFNACDRISASEVCLAVPKSGYAAIEISVKDSACPIILCKRKGPLYLFYLLR